jgi:hypothetical protein
MTDWLPWGAVVMVGTFVTLGLLVRAVGRTPVGERPQLRAVWWALWVSVVLGLATFSMYLLTGERWIWYH